MTSDSCRLQLAFDESLVLDDSLFRVMEVLARFGFSIERVGNAEPFRTPYSPEAVHRLVSEPPVTAHMPCKSVGARGKSVTAFFLGCLPVDPDRGSNNVMSVDVKSPRPAQVGALIEVAEEVLGGGSLGYAWIDRTSEFRRQHVKGTHNDRLPGIFWLNIFSRRVIDAIGGEAIESLPWSRVKSVENGLMAWLYEEYEHPPTDVLTRIEEIKSSLGQEKFVAGGWTDIPVLAQRYQVLRAPNPKVDVPERQQFAADMRRDADICIRNAAKGGWYLDGTRATLREAEDVIDNLTPWLQASSKLREGMVRVIGAYFGEVLVRETNGSWVYDTQYHTGAVETPSGLRMFPHARVAKRWEQGSSCGLEVLLDFAAGDQGRGATS